MTYLVYEIEPNSRTRALIQGHKFRTVAMAREWIEANPASAWTARYAAKVGDWNVDPYCHVCRTLVVGSTTRWSFVAVDGKPRVQCTSEKQCQKRKKQQEEQG